MSALAVLKAGPGATVQDLGRRGLLTQAVPVGGAWLEPLHRCTNLALGNPEGSATVELPLHGARFRAVGALTVALDGVPVALRDGETLDVPPAPWAVRYLALPGGVAVPVALGARGTLLCAGVGGLQGRALRVGDLLPAQSPTPLGALKVCAWDPCLGAPLPVVPGPDALPPGALEVLLGAVWTVSARLDRRGTRLEGPRLPTLCDRPGSWPMVPGAVEVPQDGVPIVLGPEHPTTGGYPVVAVLPHAARGLLAARRPGSAVRFFTAWPGGCSTPRAG
ncbi:MAG: allophanate hydrolase subunit 2 family protein [Deltaproteobacteria bacterium]|nr:allophanate hydrolase subunit 2 family protein [Deltaproteobacteria bacterium]